MSMSFKEKNMEAVLEYVKKTEKSLDDMQLELKTLEDKKNEYLSNLYAGETELSKKYLEYVNSLRMHLMKQGFPLDESKHLSLQNPDFFKSVLEKYGIEIDGGFEVFNDYWATRATYPSEAEAHLSDKFKKYEEAINSLQEKFNINCFCVHDSYKKNEKYNPELDKIIRNKAWKYENGKIYPELEEKAQKFFYNVIGNLDIWENYLNDKLEQDNPGSLKKMADLRKQITRESDYSNQCSSHSGLGCVFLILLAKTDFIDLVLKYANNEMEAEDRKALESLCSFKYFNKDNVQNGSVGAFCDELEKNSSFKQLVNGDKEKVLDTLGNFWDGCLKNEDEKKNKIVQAKKKFGIEIKVIKPNEVKIIKPEEKLADNNYIELNLNLNGPIQNENEFNNNNLGNENKVGSKININENVNPASIDGNNHNLGDFTDESTQNKEINSVTAGYPNNINHLQNLNKEIVVEVDDKKNDIDIKPQRGTKSNTVSKVCFWTFGVLDVLFIIGCIIYPPIGFALIATVPGTAISGYYFWTQLNDNKKPDLKVCNDNTSEKINLINTNREQKLEGQTPNRTKKIENGIIIKEQ